MTSPRVLLLIPPLTQLNTPYPSTAYLTGFLRSQGVTCDQADIGLEMVLRLFSKAGLQALFEEVRSGAVPLPREARTMLANERRYLETVDRVVAFLQGRDPAFATDLLRADTLPKGPRFTGRRRFPASVALEDRAKQWATFYLEDLADLTQAVASPCFALSRYGEHLARSASSFDPLATALAAPFSITDQFTRDAVNGHLARAQPHLVGLTVPFPGNVFGALRIAQAIKEQRPDVAIALGGGYVNTELRRLREPRVFDYVDFITLDGGEEPLLALVEHIAGGRPVSSLRRTFHRKDGAVRFVEGIGEKSTLGTAACPTYQGLHLNRYLTILDSTNPMHRLWSEGHWNKLTVAHGCYWKQCTFCDVGLDYIARYDPTPTARLVSHIEQLLRETGRDGFHFVDEAAPPAGLKAMALGLLERDVRIRWWGNIRFEEAFSADLCRLLAASGCIAVSAGLETASDRLLQKMKKGINLDHTASVTASFRQAGILVHAYLMYGFPSETLQETVDALERVRQLFAADLLQSAFWHRFTATAHSPIGLDPLAHGIHVVGPRFQGFAENDLQHRDDGGELPEWIGTGLRRSMLNFIEGRGLALDVRAWFDEPVPKPRVRAAWLRRALRRQKRRYDDPSVERRLVWLGMRPDYEKGSPDGRTARLTVFASALARPVTVRGEAATWLTELLDTSRPTKDKAGIYPRLHDAIATFPGGPKSFQSFVRSRTWQEVRRAGLLLV